MIAFSLQKLIKICFNNCIPDLLDIKRRPYFILWYVNSIFKNDLKIFLCKKKLQKLIFLNRKNLSLLSDT
jgi:hypothetical protein